MEGFSCPLGEIKPLSEWFFEPDEKICRTCMVETTGGMYVVILEENGEAEESRKLDDILENADNTLTIAEELDRIKSVVGEDAKAALLEIDCFVQSYEPE